MIPIPKYEETKAQYISRCMCNELLIKQYSDLSSREQVAKNRWTSSGMQESSGNLCEDLICERTLTKSTQEMSGGYNMPDLNKYPLTEELDEEQLIYYHDQLHALWERLIQGYAIGWTFGDIARVHLAIIKQMSYKGLKHIHPVNNLDMVK